MIFRSDGRGIGCTSFPRNRPRDGPEGGDAFVVIVVEIRVGAGFYNDHLAGWIDINVLPPDADRDKIALRIFGNPPFVPIAEGPAAQRIVTRL